MFPERIMNLKFRDAYCHFRFRLKVYTLGSFICFHREKQERQEQLKRMHNVIIDMSEINVERSSAVSVLVQNGEDWILLKEVKGKQDKDNGYLGEKKGGDRSNHPI